MKNITNKGLARFVARQILGLIFFMAGYWKCFDLTPIGHADKFFIESFADTWIPTWLLWATGVSIPVIELVAGALLILGLFQRFTLLVLGAILIIVTYGHLLLDPLFSPIHHVFPRVILLIIVFVLPADEDRWAVDTLRNKYDK